jgi:hypothetical protein
MIDVSDFLGGIDPDTVWIAIDMQLICGKHLLDLSRPVVMGILNTTPDSFSDGGTYYAGNKLSLDLVVRRAEQMLLEGAKIIEYGCRDYRICKKRRRHY